MTAELVLQIVLTVAAALVGVGVFGALSQQSIVMIMMGFELALNGVLLAGAAAWYFLARRAGLRDPALEDHLRGLTEDEQRRALERANRLR